MLMSNNCFLCDRCQKYKRGSCPENSFCLKLFKIEKLFNNSLLPDSKRNSFSLHIDKDGTDRDEFKRLSDISDNIDNFVNSGKNLYIYSTNCGNGKTSWAIRMLQKYIDKIWIYVDIEVCPCKALFINVPNFFIQLKNNISDKTEMIQHINKYVFEADLVVWDDIGTKIGTEFEIENLLSIIDNRLLTGKSNIYTSNIMPMELMERVGERLYSRIINNSINVCFHGKDKRGISN